MSLREKLRTATRTELLSAAESVLAEKGFEAASMALIAKTAGISVGCLYNYFKEKEQLVSHIISRRREELLKLIDIETTKNKNADFETKLSGFVRVVVEYLSFNASYSKIVFSSDTLIPNIFKNLSKEGQKTKILSIVEEFSHYLIPIIALGISKKIIKKATEKYYSYLLLGLIRGAFVYRVQANSFSPQEDINTILDIFFSGIKIYEK